MAASEIAELVTQATPAVTAAIGTYGALVLAKAEDQVADATVTAGTRFLQRVFGRRDPGEPLPKPLADAVAHPHDDDYQAALRLAIREILQQALDQGDTSMFPEARAMLTGSAKAIHVQHNHAGRDMYNIVGETVYFQPTLKPRPDGPTVVGDVPQQPAAFQPRTRLMEALGSQSGGIQVVYAITGIRGVGKTQIAAACARQRIAERWRLVAWVNASDEASLLAGLAEVAEAIAIGKPGTDTRKLAEKVRHRLEADGDQRLLVFDNADNLDMLRPFLPTAGTAQIIITTARRSAAELYNPVPVDVFSEEEALTYLAARTGLDDENGARELANELGFIPLGLSQAAAVVARDYLTYGEYLERLRSSSISGHLKPVRGDPYPRGLAGAIGLSLDSLVKYDSSGMRRLLMGMIVVLAETGVPRDWLRNFPLGDRVEVDAALRDLVDVSLASFSGERARASVAAHRLVMRVFRERLAAKDNGRGLLGATNLAVLMLRAATAKITEAWRDSAAVRDLVGQVGAIMSIRAAYTNVFAEEMSEEFLWLRLHSVRLLLELGDSIGLGLAIAEPLTTDCERILGDSHRLTLSARNNLAMAYRAAGRVEDAMPLYEMVVADSRGMLGDDHPETLVSMNNLAATCQTAGKYSDAIRYYQIVVEKRRINLGNSHRDTLVARNNLGTAYLDAGQVTDAIPILEATRDDWRQVADDDDPSKFSTWLNLARAYQATRRTVEAIPLFELALNGRERVLSADHPDIRSARIHLADAYRTVGRSEDAVPLYERIAADCLRALGNDHRETLVSKSDLARAYRAAGRAEDAISLSAETVADCERVFGLDNSETWSERINLASAYHAAGNVTKADSLYEQAIPYCERAFGYNHPTTEAVRKNLRSAKRATGH